MCLLQQQAQASLRSLVCGPVEGGALVTVRSVHASARHQQRGRTFGGITRARPVERRVLRPVPCVHLGACLDERRHDRCGVLATRPVQRSALLTVTCIDVWFLLEHSTDEGEGLSAVIEPPSELGSQVQHRALLVVHLRHARAFVNQEQRHLELSLCHCLPQWRLHRVVDRIDISTNINCCADERLVPMECKPVQWCHVVLVCRGDRRPLPDEQLSRAHSGVLACEQQRGA
mmetsp:Transcript_4249/g.9209  ORF Transcript_4249/g.9209 Transcript_4249/m.9209 type:complete len:231 (+) Transcript_4249:1076-1768(+)